MVRVRDPLIADLTNFLQRRSIGSEVLGTRIIGSEHLKPGAILASAIARRSVGSQHVTVPFDSPGTFRHGSHPVSGRQGSFLAFNAGSARFGTLRGGRGSWASLTVGSLQVGTLKAVGKEVFVRLEVGSLLVGTMRAGSVTRLGRVGSLVQVGRAGTVGRVGRVGTLGNVGSARFGTVRVERGALGSLTGVGRVGTLREVGLLTRLTNLDYAGSARFGTIRGNRGALGSMTRVGRLGSVGAVGRVGSVERVVRIGSLDAVGLLGSARAGTLRAGLLRARPGTRTATALILEDARGSTVARLQHGTLILDRFGSIRSTRGGSARYAGPVVAGAGSFLGQAYARTGLLGSARVGTLRGERGALGSMTRIGRVGSLGAVGRFGTVGVMPSVGTATFRNIASALALRVGSLRVTNVGSITQVTGSLVRGAVGSFKVNYGRVGSFTRAQVGTFTTRNIASVLALRVGSLRAERGSFLRANIGTLTARSVGSLLQARFGSARARAAELGTLWRLGRYRGGSFIGSRAMFRAQLGSEHIRARGIGTEKIADLRVGSVAVVGTIGVVTRAGSLRVGTFVGGDADGADIAFSPDAKRLWLVKNFDADPPYVRFCGTAPPRVLGSKRLGTAFKSGVAFDRAGRLWALRVVAAGTGVLRKHGTADMRVLASGTVKTSGSALGVSIDVDPIGNQTAVWVRTTTALQKFGSTNFSRLVRVDTVTAGLNNFRFTREGLAWLSYSLTQGVVYFRQAGTGNGRIIGSIARPTVALSADIAVPFAFAMDTDQLWCHGGPAAGAAYGTLFRLRAFGRYLTFSPVFLAGQIPALTFTPVGRNVGQGMAARPNAGSFRLAERFPSDGAIGLGLYWNAWAKLQ